jgi:hypothetical protein
VNDVQKYQVSLFIFRISFVSLASVLHFPLNPYSDEERSHKEDYRRQFNTDFRHSEHQ